ncbi:hypothetical protein [Aeromonas enteropelogenes]|uniref:hypothetical protein n=1 Tax=Aeromonas enteropelogenes TaxID=29489 RepID=UPI003B9DDDC8
MNKPLEKIIQLDNLLYSQCSTNDIEHQLQQQFGDLSRPEIIVLLSMWIKTLRPMATKVIRDNSNQPIA